MTEYIYDGYHVKVFKESVSWTPPLGINKIDVLVCGAGGSGNSNLAGGGGAGGLIIKYDYWINGEEIPIVIGQGIQHANGEDSSFGVLLAKGGGLGGQRFTTHALPGGSGGGSGAESQESYPTQILQNSPSAGFGMWGGRGTGTGTSSAGGGGGGANNNGGNASSGTAGNGGAGINLSSLFGTSEGVSGVFCAGGQGGRWGARGAVAVDYTGNGGGGAGGDSFPNGHRGGHGIVIVRWKYVPVLYIRVNGEWVKTHEVKLLRSA